jgi:hypothetical protein
LFSAKGRSSAKPVPVDDSAMAPVALRIPSRQRLRIPERLPAGTYQVAKEVDHPNHGSFRVSATIRVTH